MRIKFQLFESKISLLAIQPTEGVDCKIATSADINKPIIWQANFSTDDIKIEKVQELSGHNFNTKVISWSPDGHYLVTCCDYPLLWRDSAKGVK